MDEKFKYKKSEQDDIYTSDNYDKPKKPGDLINATATFEKRIREVKFEKAWKETGENEIIARLNGGQENLEQTLGSFPAERLAEAFELTGKSFGCSDGRTSYEGEDKLVKLGMAGAGIMLFPRITKEDGKLETNSEWLNRLSKSEKYDKFLDSLIRLNVKEIYGHDECGAAEKVNGKEMGRTDPLIFAEYMVLSLEEKGWYPIAKHLDFDGKHKMRNEIHDERALILDGTGRFNPEKLGFPSHYMVNTPSFNTDEDVEANQKTGAELLVTDDDLVTELETLSGVAKGHGFGDKFTSQEPFYLLIIARSEKQLDYLQKLAEAAKNKVPNLPIKIDSYILNK